MLDLHAQMIDIDINSWAYLQSKLIRSGRELRRIIIIHEEGNILKFVHSHGKAIRKVIDKITNPFEDAKRVYEANKEIIDYVIIINREGVEEYFAELQEKWDPNESIIEYTIKMRRLLDKYHEKSLIVTYPGKPTDYLGWIPTVKINYEDIVKFVRDFIVPESLVVLFVFEEQELKANLILGFNKELKIDLITSLDILKPLRVEEYDWKHNYKELITIIEGKIGRKVSLGIFVTEEILNDIIERGYIDLGKIFTAPRENKILLYPIPDKLKISLQNIMLTFK